MKKGMTMHTGIFTGNYVKNMTLKEYHSGKRMSRMELLRTKCTRFFENSQSSVISRLKLDDQILFLFVKTRKRLRSDINIPGDTRVNQRETGKIEKYEMLPRTWA